MNLPKQKAKLFAELPARFEARLDVLKQPETRATAAE